MSNRVLRRLTASEGYLELGMPMHAMEELDAIEDAGELESAKQYLRGEALKAQSRFADAIPALHQAAVALPTEDSQLAWQSMSECFREIGNSKLAKAAAANAAAIGKQIEGGTTVTLQLPLRIKVVLKSR